MTTTPWTPDKPIVTVTITEPDLMAVTVFGIDYPPPPWLTPLRRSSFGALMDHLYDRLRQPFTVEITETDGTTQTGLIDLSHTPADTPPPPPTHTPTPAPAPVLDPSPRRAIAPDTNTDREPGTVRLCVPGFTPGEPVRVAYVTEETTADPTNGESTIDLPRLLLGTLLDGEVVLLGCRSGLVASRRPLTEL